MKARARSFTMNEPRSVSMATWSQRQTPYDEVSIISPILHPKRARSGAGQASSFKVLPQWGARSWEVGIQLQRRGSLAKGPVSGEYNSLHNGGCIFLFVSVKTRVSVTRAGH